MGHPGEMRSTAPSRSAEALVRFEEVKKSYDGVNFVVSGLNLSVRRGEFLTMLGPSGSGKTTTLMMLGGLSDRRSGASCSTGSPSNGCRRRSAILASCSRTMRFFHI